jgi:hypothetical protein
MHKARLFNGTKKASILLKDGGFCLRKVYDKKSLLNLAPSGAGFKRLKTVEGLG